MYVALLIAVAVLLAWPVPRLLPRVRALRAVPAAGLVLWQSVSVAAITAGLLAAPLAVLVTVRGESQRNPDPFDHLPILVVGLAVSAFLLVRLLIRGHKVGTELRRNRKVHAELVDLIGLDDTPDGRLQALGSSSVRVLTHPTPTAYCVPGARKQVVLTQGTLDTLNDDELAAVLAHERAHLRRRHDLVLEFFTVLHTAVPVQVHSAAGLREVKLLIELLADRSAVAVAGKKPLGAALVALASGTHPSATLGATDAALVRLEHLASLRARPHLRATVLLASILVLAAPLLLALATLVGA